MMKALVMTIVMFFCSSLGWGATASEQPMVHIIFQQPGIGQQVVVIEMFDNPASRDFMSLLPLTLELSDFAHTEKIATLPRPITTKNSPTANKVPSDAAGDFSYYAPWGNIAVFYRGVASDDQLYILGRIVSGKEKLANLSGNFTATMVMESL